LDISYGLLSTSIQNHVPDHVNLDSSHVLAGLVIGVYDQLKLASMELVFVEISILNQTLTQLGWCYRIPFDSRIASF